MSNKFYKLDLHTHSIISYDGGISKKEYIKILENNILDFVAITDHNRVDFAKALRAELGDKIIIGEEIKTLDGEIIGLFLNTKINPGLSASETIKEIKRQNGLVYIPHPFEKGRSSLQTDLLGRISEEVDIIEVFNGRGLLRGNEDLALRFAKNNEKVSASSSDAHCRIGIGTAYSIVSGIPDHKSLLKLLKSSNLQKQNASFVSLFCPGFNKIKNTLFLSK